MTQFFKKLDKYKKLVKHVTKKKTTAETDSLQNNQEVSLKFAYDEIPSTDLTNIPPSPIWCKDIKYKYCRDTVLQEILHKGIIKYNEGHIVLLSKKHISNEEYLILLKRAVSKKKVLPDPVFDINAETGRIRGYLKILTPSVISDQGSSLLRFENVRVSTSEIPFPANVTVTTRFPKNKSLPFQFEEFYYIYEGYCYMPLNDLQTRNLQRVRRRTKITDRYNIEFSVGNEGDCLITLSHKDSTSENLRGVFEIIWLIIMFLVEDEIVNISSLSIFLPLLVFYKLSYVFCFILGFLFFQETFRIEEQRLDHSRKITLRRVRVKSEVDDFLSSINVIRRESSIV